METHITVSIIPAKNSSPHDRDKLQGWKKSDLKSLDSTTFAGIMTEVIKMMGIEAIEGKPKKTFSNDVLRLEIAGPDQEHFSVIDVPGIFKRTTQGLTTKEDMVMVNDMVYEYMSNPRSVMLTVIPCNVDIATQEILERAEDIDPEGIRTFGILTKPDLVDKGSEGAVISLVEGKTHQLRLGWHLLRNPGQADLKSTLRSRNDLEMDFFTKVHPWSMLDEGKVGIVSLRSRLQEVLEDHIRREFPKVKAEISKKLKTAEASLQSLGPKRQSQTEHSQYVMGIALDFQKVASLAVNSDYSRSDILSMNNKFRIATEVVNRGQKFADAMASHGHTHDFLAGEKKKPIDINFTNGQIQEDELSVRTVDDHLDIQDVVYENVAVSLPSGQDILTWLKDEYRGSRGFELGTFDAALLAITMKQQAAKWWDLALGYVSDVVSLVHYFILGVLERITPSARVFEGIKSRITDQIVQMYQVAISRTRFLLHVELDGTPATYNHYFNETVEMCRNKRLCSRLEECSISHHDLGIVVKLDDITRSDPLSIEDHTVLEIHDILRSYYKVARKRFVDCVRMQVADTLLVTGLETPLTLFSANFVTRMTPEALKDIAGEDSVVKRRREDLEKLVGQLRRGKAIIG